MSEAGEKTRLSVLLPHRLGLLTYAAEAPLAPGTIVTAPLGGRSLLGVVWDDPPDRDIAASRLKDVAVVETPCAIPTDLRRFSDFVARYTMASRGAVLKMVLRMPEALAPPRPVTAIKAAVPTNASISPARRRVIEALAMGPLARKALVETSGTSSSTIAAMLKAGELAEITLSAPVPPALDPERDPPALSAEQARAAAAFREAVAKAQFSPILLDGVTGSGKTEVFLEAAAEAVSAGRQALILMPEIALTPMVMERIADRFGARPAAWHSGRTPAARTALWRDVAAGRAPIVVGARSALFLPFPTLGVVIVDEEHDPSYKQDDGVTYHARDMAVVRAQTASIPIILTSATPSVETRINVERERYGQITLPSRYGGAPLPRVEAVDLRADPPPAGDWLAPAVRAEISRTVAAGEQALLFLNRRGYAPLTLCRRCGHRFQCRQCSAALVEHRLRNRLVCHHCGFETPRPASCPACGGADTLVPCGPGVERVAEEAAALWPAARTITLSSDLTAGDALTEGLAAIANGAVDIIIGTQLVAKGHTFPKLQLVVVVDADLGLGNADPRAAERTFQLLTQVTGRAGRVSDGGRALLQTHAPDHPVIEAMVNGDEAAFYAEETDVRRESGLPPFQRLAGIIVSAKDRSEAYAHASALARTAPTEGIEVLGPAEAPLAILRGRFRFRLLVRAPRSAPLQDVLADWLGQTPVDGTLRRTVDIDPQSFL